MAEEGVVHELHVFSEGAHGLSVANRNTESENVERQQAVHAWVDLAFDFLSRQGIC